jgi:hypothetical protein
MTGHIFGGNPAAAHVTPGTITPPATSIGVYEFAAMRKQANMGEPLAGWPEQEIGSSTASRR